MNHTFAAPHSFGVKVITLAALLLTLALFVARQTVGGSVMLGVLALCVGSRLPGRRGRLTVLHYGWASRWRLAELEQAEVLSGAMAGSLRLAGVGGL